MWDWIGRVQEEGKDENALENIWQLIWLLTYLYGDPEARLYLAPKSGDFLGHGAREANKQFIVDQGVDSTAMLFNGRFIRIPVVLCWTREDNPWFGQCSVAHCSHCRAVTIGSKPIWGQSGQSNYGIRKMEKSKAGERKIKTNEGFCCVMQYWSSRRRLYVHFLNDSRIPVKKMLIFNGSPGVVAASMEPKQPELTCTWLIKTKLYKYWHSCSHRP